MQTHDSNVRPSVREHFTDKHSSPAYLSGLRDGLELTQRHNRMNLAFAFALGACVALALASWVGGAA